MDLRFKKLLLLAMQFNNANKLKIKSTPNKIVNLQLFSSVIILYNYLHKYKNIIIHIMIHYTLNLKHTNTNLISGDDHNIQHCHGYAQDNEWKKLILVRI